MGLAQWSVASDMKQSWKRPRYFSLFLTFAVSLKAMVSSAFASEPPLQKFKLNAKQYKEWIQAHPEAQRILSLPDGPEKELFQRITDETLQFLEQDKDNALGFAGTDSQGVLFGMTFGMTDQIMSSPPRQDSAHPFPEFLGLIMQSQYIAIDQGSRNLEPLVFNRMMAGMRFLLQAIASGHHTPAEIQALAEKTDITIVNVINGRKVENKFKATEPLRILASVGLPLSHDNTTLAPHWKYWNAFSYKPLEGQAELRMTPTGPRTVIRSRQPLGVFHVLDEQIQSNIAPHLHDEWKQAWAENLKERLNWELHFGKEHGLNDNQKLQVIDAILNVREPNPTRFTRSITEALSKFDFIDANRMGSKAIRNLWKDILNSSMPIIYETRQGKLGAEKEFIALKKREAEQSRQEQERAERKLHARKLIEQLLRDLHDLDPETSYASHHASFLLSVLEESIAQGRTPLPNEPRENLTIEKIVNLLKQGILVEQDHNPILSAHLQELERTAALHLGRQLEDKEKLLVREAQAQVFTQRIIETSEETSQIQLPLTIRSALFHLGLVGESPVDHFRLYQVPYLRGRDSENASKTLRRSSLESLRLNSSEHPSKLAFYIIKRLNIDETVVHAELSNEPFTHADLPKVREQLTRALMILIHKSPSGAEELQSHLQNTKLLQAITGQPQRINLSKEILGMVFDQAMKIMHTMSYAPDCKALFRNMSLTGTRN